MEGAGASLRYGLAGFVAGSSTGWATDKVFGLIAPHLTMGTQRSTVTQAALSAVVGGAIASVMIYAGDRVLESVVDMDADPLFRTTFYQSAFLGSSTARMVVSNVQSVWSSLMLAHKGGPMAYNPMPVAKNNPVQEPGPVMQPNVMPPPTQRRATPSCQSGTSCGSIML